MNKLKQGVIIAILALIHQDIFTQTISDTTRYISTLDELVFSASRNKDVRRSVSPQILLLKQSTIEESQAKSMAEVLSMTGQVFVQKSQAGGGSPVLRGFEANRCLLVVDGVRLNNLIYRGGHLQNIITLDNQSLERVEILFGPSSTMYGSDALGGVIHMTTKSLEFAGNEKSPILRLNAFGRISSAEKERTIHADFQLGGKKWSMLTSLTASNFGDVTMGKMINPFYGKSFGERPYYIQRINGRDSLLPNDNQYAQVQSAYQQFDIVQKLGYKPNQHSLHILNVQYSTSGDIPRYDRLTDPAGSGLRFAEWYYGPQKRLMTAYSFQYKNENCYFQQFQILANYQNIEESRHSRRFNNSNLQSRIEKVDVIGLNLDAVRSSGRHFVYTGLDVQYNQLKSTAHATNINNLTQSPLDTRYPDGDNSMKTAALYASHRYQWSSNWSINEGLRLGYGDLNSTLVDTTFFHFPFNQINQKNVTYSANAGINYTPGATQRYVFLISSGFRIPNVDDLSKVFESGNGTIIVPNQNLRPEQTLNFELTATHRLFGRIEWENNLYYTGFYNAIVTLPFEYNGQDSIVYNGRLSGVMANQNARKAFIAGASSQIKCYLNKSFIVSGNISYTYGRITGTESTTPLDHIPPVTGIVRADYFTKKWKASFFSQFNGWKRLKNYYLGGEDNEQYATPEGTPAWFTLNIRATYNFWSSADVTLGIDNILDTQYRLFASGINAPGRNFIGALRYRF
ncbi:MAG: TonB-dependent receptor [Saprospiraceae bacterium]